MRKIKDTSNCSRGSANTTYIPASKLQLERIPLNCSVFKQEPKTFLHLVRFGQRLSNDLLHGQIWARLSNDLLTLVGFLTRLSYNPQWIGKMKYMRNTLKVQILQDEAQWCSCKLSKWLNLIWVLELHENNLV